MSTRSYKDITGLVYGNLTAIQRVGKCRTGHSTWLFQCTCGQQKVLVSGDVTRRFHPTRSCGCLRQSKIEAAPLNRLYESYIKSAESRGIMCHLSIGDIAHLTSQNCHYCGRPPTRIKEKRLPYNGIDRIDNAKGYCLENCVPCCIDCNKAKSTLNYDDFIALIHLIAIRHSAT